MAAPTNVRVHASGQGSNLIKWTYTAATAITIHRSIDGLLYALIATVSPGSTGFYEDTGLANKTKYWYKLSDDGGSTFSSVVTVVTHVTQSVRNSKATFHGRRAKGATPTAQDFNEMIDALEVETNVKHVSEDPCPLCIVDGAIVIDCMSGCDYFRVIMDQDINSVSIVGCDDCPDVDFVIPPNEERGICGFPIGCDFAGDECFQGRIPGGTDGRTAKTNGLSYDGYGQPSPRLAPSDCPCPPLTQDLSIQCCQTDCTLTCS